jgi:hypothetical protein
MNGLKGSTLAVSFVVATKLAGLNNYIHFRTLQRSHKGPHVHLSQAAAYLNRVSATRIKHRCSLQVQVSSHHLLIVFSAPVHT